MPKDFNGREVVKGDIVMIPCEVLFTQPFELKANISVVPLHKGDPRVGNPEIHLVSTQTIVSELILLNK